MAGGAACAADAQGLRHDLVGQDEQGAADDEGGRGLELAVAVGVAAVRAARRRRRRR